MADAQVTIGEIYSPLLWNHEIQEASTINNRFVRSGILAQNALYDSLASQPGTLIDLPFYQPLLSTTTALNEPNVSSDVAATKSETKNIDKETQIAIKCQNNDSWSTMDLAVEIASQDPTGAITGSIGQYWTNDAEQKIINIMDAITEDNRDNNAGDMISTIAVEIIGSQTAATRISGDAVIDAIQTGGDQGQYDCMAMHSVQYRELQKQDLIAYIQPSGTNISIPTYLGMEVVFDDRMPVRAGTTSGFVYSVYLFKKGVFALGMGSPKNPTAVTRDETAGAGAGQDIIHSRQTKIVHPQGFKFNSISLAGTSPTWAELATKTNWTRVVERKNVGMAILEVN